eukprot:SAG31_NODE_10747_length_1103_cov_0.955179_1_plen_229_part_01
MSGARAAPVIMLMCVPVLNLVACIACVRAHPARIVSYRTYISATHARARRGVLHARGRSATAAIKTRTAGAVMPAVPRPFTQLLLTALTHQQLVVGAAGESDGGRPSPCQLKGGCPDDVHALCQPAEVKPQWPTFHLMDNVTRLRDGSLYVEGLNDINAVFSHRGLYHIMNQAGGGDWTNAVSADLVHWYHLNHALDASTTGPLAREKWGGPCDGTLSFPDLGRDPYNG